MIRVKLSHDEKWVVEKFLDEHNHPFDIPSHVPRQWSHKSFHRSKECKDLVTLLSKEGIRPSEITKIMNAYQRNHEDKLTRFQCSTIISDERRRNFGKECHGVIMHFKERAEVDKDFYFATNLSTDGTLRNVFWADEGALLENETEITFTWLFKQFLKCMHDCPPVSINTDQDLVMGIAIEKVFPQTRHRYCAWHIQKHVLDHLQPLRSRYDDFQDTYTKWVKSQNTKDYKAKWLGLKEKYHIDDDYMEIQDLETGSIGTRWSGVYANVTQQMDEAKADNKVEVSLE
nr:protein FAR1-related sequence 5-like [Tanacetum cinerariifolium]